MRKIALTLAAALFMSLAPQVQATTIYYLDIGPCVDAAYTNGNTWNGMQAWEEGSVSLQDTAGSSHGVSAEWTTKISSNDNAGLPPANLTGAAAESAAGSIALGYTTSSGTLTFSGLDMTKPYVFTVFGGANRDKDRNGRPDLQGH